MDENRSKWHPPQKKESPKDFIEEESSKSKQDLTEKEGVEYLVKTFVQALAGGAEKLFYVGLERDTPGEDSAALIDCPESKPKKTREIEGNK